MAAIKDIFITVEVPKIEYEALIRESEQIAMIRSLLRENRYVSTEDLKAMLNVSEETEGRCE